MADKRKVKRRTAGFRANATGNIWNEYAYVAERKAEVEARDTIIAEGYADRQIARSLELAGKVNTEL